MSTLSERIGKIDLMDYKSVEERKKILNTLCGIQDKIIHSADDQFVKSFNQFQKLRAEGKIT